MDDRPLIQKVGNKNIIHLFGYILDTDNLDQKTSRGQYGELEYA